MYSAPHLVSEVKDADGKLVYKRKGVTRAAVGKDATGKLGGLLRDAVVALERRRDGDIIGQTGSADDDARRFGRFVAGWFVRVERRATRAFVTGS